MFSHEHTTTSLHSLAIGFAVLCVTSGTRPAAADAPYFMGLGDLPGGIFQSYAFGISDDGTTVVGRGKSANGTEAFRWTADDGMVALGDLPGGQFNSGAGDASFDGSVIVGRGETADGARSFRWTEQTGMVELSNLPDGNGEHSAAEVSADGSVIVGWMDTVEGREAYRWTADDGMIGLGYLLPSDARNSKTTGVSADGRIVCGNSYHSPCSGDAYEPFRWTAEDGMVGLGGLGQSCAGFAYGISPDGSSIVGWTAGGSVGAYVFRWTDESGMESLGHTIGSSGTGAVSEGGAVVVGDLYTYTEPVFIWDAGHGLRSLVAVLRNDCGLDLTGWILEIATGISADGRTIVGYGTNPDGNREAWIAYLGSKKKRLVYNRPDCPGDVDGDGDVDQSDLAWLLGYWGCTGGDCSGDLDGDGDTDQGDLGILLSDWGCGT